MSGSAISIVILTDHPVDTSLAARAADEAARYVQTTSGLKTAVFYSEAVNVEPKQVTDLKDWADQVSGTKDAITQAVIDQAAQDAAERLVAGSSPLQPEHTEIPLGLPLVDPNQVVTATPEAIAATEQAFTPPDVTVTPEQEAADAAQRAADQTELAKAAAESNATPVEPDFSQTPSNPAVIVPTLAAETAAIEAAVAADPAVVVDPTAVPESNATSSPFFTPGNPSTATHDAAVAADKAAVDAEQADAEADQVEADAEAAKAVADAADIDYVAPPAP
jgi:hypothetical protein